jgi:hypothetical protein
MAIALLAPGLGAAQPTGRTALINGDTVSGAPSLEEQAAVAAGLTVTVVPQSTWAAMTQTQFGAYDLLIIGDAACHITPQAAAANAAVGAGGELERRQDESRQPDPGRNGPGVSQPMASPFCRPSSRGIACSSLGTGLCFTPRALAAAAAC